MERPFMIGCACTCRYRNISSDRQRPIMRRRSLSTPAQRRAIAPPARVERMGTSVKVYAGSGWRCKTARIRAVMSEGEM